MHLIKKGVSMKFTFKGGVHPPSSKGLTKDLPIKVLKAPEKVIAQQKEDGAKLQEKIALLKSSIEKLG